jgi:E3 ubiquitin-protein ligase BIG BROTHER-like protein
MDFEGGEMVKKLGCSHLYHSGCIAQWLGINKVCPVCNAEVKAAGPAGTAQGAAAAVAAAAAPTAQ